MESISYTDTPLTVKTAMIRVKVSRLDGPTPTQVKFLTYDQVTNMEGGEEALDKYGPVWTEETIESHNDQQYIDQ